MWNDNGRVLNGDIDGMKTNIEDWADYSFIDKPIPLWNIWGRAKRFVEHICHHAYIPNPPTLEEVKERDKEIAKDVNFRIMMQDRC